MDNRVHWPGAIEGFAAAVLPACDRAVARRPDFGPYLDSRGSARVRAPETHAAPSMIERRLSAWSRAHFAYATPGVERERWITQIDAGSDPFDARTLTQLADGR